MGDLTYDPLDDIEDEKLDAARESGWVERWYRAGRGPKGKADKPPPLPAQKEKE